MPSAEHQIARLEFVVREQMKEIDKLRSENERLRTGADAHATLRAIYRDPEASQTNKVKAASAAIGFEKPRLSVTAYLGQRDRRLAWQAYEVWARRRRIIEDTRDVPPKDYAADLLASDYQAPEGTDMPPVDVELGPSGFVVLTNLLAWC